MEALRGYTTSIYFPVPEDLTSARFRVFRDGAQIGLLGNATLANGLATVPLPYSSTLTDGEVTVQLEFVYQAESIVQTRTATVVTPLLDKYEILEIYPEATDAEVVEIERAVRVIIQAHTGQSFGLFEGTKSVEGHGERALRLPERLVELTGLSTRSAVLNPNSAIVVSDGWYLKKGWSEEVSSIEDDSTYWTGWEPTQDAAPGEPGYEKPGHGHVIAAPGVRATPTQWADDYPFAITGKWGYTSVPTAVKEAAKLLVNDYACSEIAYRDRYLESIKAADWRLQFNERAWESTGNVRADQLLDEYVILDWAVI